MRRRIKICGIRDAATLAATLEAGADDVGLVLFPPSPRNVALDQARELAAAARSRARIVVLTVDADDTLLAAIAGDIRPDLLQLHGSESPARASEIRDRFAIPVMKAVKVATADDARLALEYAGSADLILFDARPPKGADRPGGHGVPFDWHALDGIKERVPYMLSGGLTPANVAEAICATGATAVDVSSGVERAPGIKDTGLIRAFIAAVRAIDPLPSGEPGHSPSVGSTIR